ncbi:Oidioi.mRNA.OKI2018_I69.chr1.g104.t1.cds [Oikopleura dioica]|uniref:Oidioi.mRNA.OKI2018_I69.chr1.g104.t1.cds n=1 Tax=Oikopleura dioica TaxID=34765 RepID=A0ABN7SIU3_OIKDI|nr:Oidioi.mRNA.OKI2018_I69.chr1.g104.t1.cds [Oikopleura dioica]
MVMILDLRSDTFTKPTPEMRKLMAEAEVGDDVFGEDPTVNLLQETAAQMTGKEKGLYLASTTMSNLCGILGTCWERGAEIFIGDKSHIALYEQGNVSQMGGVMVRTVPNNDDGSFDLDYLETLIHTVDDPHFPRAKAIVVEVTHNMMGGSVPSLEWLCKVREFANKHKLRVHMDGARAFNALQHLGIGIKELCAFADSVSICTSKGLGAPVGSLLVSDAATIKRCHRVRKALGGGMRQAGIIAAASLYGLTEMSKRIHEDTENAKALANVVSKFDFVEIDVKMVHSNIVRFKLKGHSQEEFIKRCGDDSEGVQVKILIVSGGFIRAVFHNDAKREAVKIGLAKVEKLLSEMSKKQ